MIHIYCRPPRLLQSPAYLIEVHKLCRPPCLLQSPCYSRSRVYIIFKNICIKRKFFIFMNICLRHCICFENGAGTLLWFLQLFIWLFIGSSWSFYLRLGWSNTTFQFSRDKNVMNMKGYRFLEVANVNTFFYQISNVLLGGSFLITFSNYCKFVILTKMI